jgi:hypothetical protein
MMRTKLITLAVAAGLLSVTAAAWAGQWTKGATVRPEMAATDVRSYIGVNNLQMVVSNIGSFAFDPSGLFGKNDGLYFPRGTNRSVVFASGLWVGARVNGAPRTAVAEYSSEYSPGTMSNGTYTPDESRFRVYKVNRGDNAATNPDYANWPHEDGAPVLKASNGEDSLDADGFRIPAIFGDQALFSVYNDANPAAHTNNAGSTLPLGVEVRQYVFAYGRGGALGNTIYLTFEIINKGENQLDDAYVSIWCDPDVGEASDDFVGCDTALSLGFAYNEGPDPVYGDAAPAVGFDFLNGPVVPSPGDSALFGFEWRHGYRNLPMTSFNMYSNNVGDPQNAFETYNYMKGLEASGDPVINPVTGEPTLFNVSGDPVAGDGWLDVNAGDRRFMMSSGPFAMAPGDTQRVVVAVLVGQGGDPLSSITSLKSVDEQVQSVFELGFNIPYPPPQPQVWAQPHANKVDLIWDARAEGDVQESDVLGQRFVMEGYNVYQGESAVGPWKKIATYDVNNGITRIYNDLFNTEIGAVERVLVQNGADDGLTNRLSLSTDKLTGQGLINHRPYYYAVTAYSCDELNLQEYIVGSSVIGHLAEVLESRIEPVTVVPNSVALPLTDTALHVLGNSDGAVTVRVLEPGMVTGHQYEVTFNDDQTWNLDDLTSATRVLSGQTPSDGIHPDPMVDGIMVQVEGPPPGVKTVEWSGGPAWITGVNWGGYYFEGGLDEGCYFFGSSICDPMQLVNVELRFSPTETQKAYRYVRGANPNYAYGGYGTVPFTAWDVSLDPPRQLNVCFVEQFALASEDSYWLPPDDAADGGREYVFILNSDYSETEDPYYTSRSIYFDGADFDVLYAWWPAVAEGHSNTELAAGQVLSIQINKYNTTADRFQFATLRAGTEEARNVSSLDGVYAVPNPYLHGTDLEEDQRHRLIKFVGLPPVDATVEIYNLVGERIRVLRKERPEDGEVYWDVLTENGLPPASGVYIYRVVAEGVAPKTGKLALFVDRERLRQF